METTTGNTVKNVFETWAEAQKKAMDSFTESTEKFQKEILNNNKTGEAADYFKKWYDSQMSFFYNNENKNSSNPMEWFNNWMGNQSDMGKKMNEMTQEWMKNLNNPAAMMNSIPGMPEETKKTWSRP